MKILVTGAKGFLGRNLCAQLENIRDGKAKNYALKPPLAIVPYDVDSPMQMLEDACRDCDFVFQLAGINRPKEASAFMDGNFSFFETVLKLLRENSNSCPIMLSSSTQATLENAYGLSKRAAEELLQSYGEQTGARTLIYRFPNLFGKWCRPNYNSAVATFCHNIANDLPIQINNTETELTLCYIDDVVDELIAALAGQEHRQGAFCRVPTEHTTKLGNLAQRLRSFHDSRTDKSVPDLSAPLNAKLYATYLSYLPEQAFSYPLEMHCDARGSFTEMLRTDDRGQVSVNISKPGIVKGNHWHNTKNEKFLVVSGTGVIRFRKVGEARVIEYHVSGEKLEVVDIPTGYTHNIENLGQSDMVTVMWASECFNPDKPDTYFMEV